MNGKSTAETEVGLLSGAVVSVDRCRDGHDAGRGTRPTSGTPPEAGARSGTRPRQEARPVPVRRRMGPPSSGRTGFTFAGLVVDHLLEVGEGGEEQAGGLVAKLFEKGADNGEVGVGGAALGSAAGALDARPPLLRLLRLVFSIDGLRRHFFLAVLGHGASAAQTASDESAKQRRSQEENTSGAATTTRTHTHTHGRTSETLTFQYTHTHTHTHTLTHSPKTHTHTQDSEQQQPQRADTQRPRG